MRSDADIAGSKWRATIQQSLDKAAVAVLPVSQHFLTPKFIMEVEVPLYPQRPQAARVNGALGDGVALPLRGDAVAGNPLPRSTSPGCSAASPSDCRVHH